MRDQSADGIIRGARPLRVVGERSGYLATWLAPGTIVATPQLADGRDLRSVPPAEALHGGAKLAHPTVARRGAVEHGVVSRPYAEGIRAEGERATRAIEAWAPPFGDGWEDWRADPAWLVPELPEDWAELDLSPAEQFRALPTVPDMAGV